jgi:hypothetical protein
MIAALSYGDFYELEGVIESTPDEKRSFEKNTFY